ncbi:MAG: hypothetical protein SFT81_07335 [Candidatus Caenarcaniphilales bacterium]|nr:hypothetical protein [Candidatus Caenarcaniphilales bacterium]
MILLLFTSLDGGMAKAAPEEESLQPSRSEVIPSGMVVNVEIGSELCSCRSVGVGQPI